MELKYTDSVQGMVFLCSLLCDVHQRVCAEKRVEGSSNFRKPDRSIYLLVGIPYIMDSSIGVGLTFLQHRTVMQQFRI